MQFLALWETAVEMKSTGNVNVVWDFTADTRTEIVVITWTKKVFCREKKAWSMFEIYMNWDSDGKGDLVLKLKIKDRNVISFVEDLLTKYKTIVRISWKTK